MSIKQHIEKLQKTQLSAANELTAVERLRIEFPDLETHEDRWATVRYMAKSANARVDNVDFRYNCGCCADSPLQAMPYLEFNGLRVYSNPFYLFVGEKTYDGYVQENHKWEKPFEDAGVPASVIDKIRQHLASLARDEDDDGADEDDDRGET